MRTATITPPSSSAAGSRTSPDLVPLRDSIRAFEVWLDRVGYESYDPYDIWGTRYGLFARRIYYQRGKLGLPFIAPLLLMELVCPRLRALFVAKERFATADGQLVMAFLNLHQATGEPHYLAKAKALAAELLKTSVPGFSGYCWGYPFDWENSGGLWKKNTPFITSTPYVYEAYVKLAEITQDPAHHAVAASIAKFVHDDLRDTPTSPTASAGSYSPFVNDRVINATAYRAWVLFDAAHRLGKEEYRAKAEKNLNFVLETQREDGSWLYAIEDSGKSFIDHFHTCFNLKNLCKINRFLQRKDIHNSIQQGWAYYRKALFHPNSDPKSFSIEPRTQIVRLEMYNFAESITLSALLRDDVPEALDLSLTLAEKLRTEHQLAAGHFVTRVFLGGMRHTMPFLRWPQAQLFYSLTNLFAALAESQPNPTRAA